MIKYLSAQNLKKFSGKTCLLRVDLNVEQGMPLDSYRLQAVLPTIKLLLKNGVKVVLLSHRGHPEIPKSKYQIPNKSQISKLQKLSLKPFAGVCAEELGVPVRFIDTPDLSKARREIMESNGEIFLLENLRFWPGEEKNDSRFAKQLASLGDSCPVRNKPPKARHGRASAAVISNGVYVNDAFAVSHRANASVAAITKYLPSYAGLLMGKEIRNLDKAMESRNHPFTIIIGGAKISDKLGVIKYFWGKADNFLIGGAPASTFLRAEGMDVGSSLIDGKAVSLMKPYLDEEKIHLPVDLRWEGMSVLDVGSRTVREYAGIIKKSKTVIWNGPMGRFERKEFGNGTRGIWKAIFENKKAHIVIGGGETVASLKTLFPKPHSLNPNLFLSTGGGAMLEYLSGEKLPGIEALKKP